MVWNSGDFTCRGIRPCQRERNAMFAAAGQWRAARTGRAAADRAGAASPALAFNAPAQHQRVQPARDRQQLPARLGMQRRPGRARGVAGDHPALLHQRLGGQEAGLAVLVVDQRQPALVLRVGGLDIATAMGFDDGPDAVGIAAASHGSGHAGLQVGQQRNGLLAVPGALDRLAAQRDQLAQLAGGAGRFHLEVRDLLDLARHAGQEGGRQRRRRPARPGS